MKYFSSFKKGKYGTCLWNDVALHKGKNEIIARTPTGREDRILLEW